MCLCVAHYKTLHFFRFPFFFLSFTTTKSDSIEYLEIGNWKRLAFIMNFYHSILHACSTQSWQTISIMFKIRKCCLYMKMKRGCNYLILRDAFKAMHSRCCTCTRNWSCKCAIKVVKMHNVDNYIMKMHASDSPIANFYRIFKIVFLLPIHYKKIHGSMAWKIIGHTIWHMI